MHEKLQEVMERFVPDSSYAHAGPPTPENKTASGLRFRKPEAVFPVVHPPGLEPGTH